MGRREVGPKGGPILGGLSVQPQDNNHSVEGMKEIPRQSHFGTLKPSSGSGRMIYKSRIDHIICRVNVIGLLCCRRRDPDVRLSLICVRKTTRHTRSDEEHDYEPRRAHHSNRMAPITKYISMRNSTWGLLQLDPYKLSAKNTRFHGNRITV